MRLPPRPGDTRQGFGYRQLFYKLRRSGRVGKFPPAQQGAIVDLREIGPIYEWIVASVRIFDFTLTFRPFGGEQPYLTIPLNEETPIVLAKPFIRAVDDPGPELLAEYGFGYAVLRNPLARGPLYGPGRFGPGFQLIDFKIRDSGEIRVCLTFVINRPQQILDVPLDPFTWSAQLANLVSLGLTSRVFAPFYALLQQTSRAAPGFDPIFGYVDLVNALTGGRAAEDLCISRVQLEKDMLVQHFMHFPLKANIIMICGHYKGIDERIRQHFVTKEISIGDYVLSGGELAAAVLVDSVGRLIPGVLNDETSALFDSFQDNLLAPPVYTRPEDFRGWKVPDELLSGNHKVIEEWRHEQSIRRTKERRPGLLENQ